MTGRSDYPPIGDYALIGDCHSAALVSRQGSIEWCCLPRFDSGSAFAAMLDRERGGICSITPTGDGSWEYARAYADDALVLETRLGGPSGELKLIDFFAVRDSTRSTPDRQIVRII